MNFFSLSLHEENRLIKLGIIVYWWLFWLLNTLDKFLASSVPLWRGRDRLPQFIDYFASIGVTNEAVALVFLIIVTILEVTALAFATFALVFFIQGDQVKTRGGVFWTIGMSLVIFSLFAIGDQIFGDRVELLEHSTYWIALVLTWYVYTHADRGLAEGTSRRRRSKK